MSDHKHTERTVLEALRARHAPKRSGGNGPEWAYVEHVRNAAGFDASRTLDAMALHLWPSRGMELHGYEVKVSRSDFRRELADPAKMDAFAGVLDRFWIVAPKGVVPAEEIPAAWGLLEVLDNGGIRQKIAAPLLTEKRVPIPRTMLVPLMRAAGAGLEHTPDEVAIRAAEERGREQGARNGEAWKPMYEEARDALAVSRKQVAAIEAALGVSLRFKPGGFIDGAGDRLEKIAEAIRAAVDGEDIAARGATAITMALRDIERARERLDRTATNIRETAKGGGAA